MHRFRRVCKPRLTPERGPGDRAGPPMPKTFFPQARPCAVGSRTRATSALAPSPARRPRTHILTERFPAYVGRQERTAYELMRRSVEQDCAIFLTFSGAMTPAGLHQSCLIPLLERGLVDCITTTGANLYHDAHRIIGHRIREIDPTAGRPAVPPRAHHPHLRPRLLGGDAPRDGQALLRPPARAGVPEEDDHARAALPARRAPRARSRRRSA